MRCAVLALLLVLAPLAHAEIASSAVASGAQASGSLTNSGRDTLSVGDDLAAHTRALLKKKPAQKGKGKGDGQKKKKKKSPSPKPTTKPTVTSPKPSPPKKPVSPPKRSPSPANVPNVIPSPSPSPSPSPPPPPACPLNVGGTVTNFQSCDSTTWPEIGTIYFTLEGETLTIGYKGASPDQGWVGVDITPNFKMANSDAVMAAGKSDGTVSPVVVRINGYNPSTFAPTTVYSDVTVGKDGAVLAATAKVSWPAGQAELPLAFTAGGLSPTGSIQKHYKYPIIKKISRTTLSVIA